MPVEINITNRQRQYINPNNGQIIPKITKGLYNLEDGGRLEETGGNGENEEEKKAE